MTKLDGAVVLVIGATGGLGTRIAAMIEDAGAIVIPTSRRAAPGFLIADLESTSSVENLITSATAVHGRLDGVIIAAGAVAFGPAADTDPAVVSRLFAVNAIGPMAVIRAAYSPLASSRERDPFIVTLSGIVSEAPSAGLAAYSASKSALASFVIAAGREYKRAGIRILDARPGHTSTALSTHPIAGTAPKFGAALAPDAVAARIVRAIIDDEKDLPSGAFTNA